ncbi:phosphatase PAP2 family protein [Sinomicrobium weinanense]|uniref:Phosphatase PAP2 family protein n=1 Tax=Sinomicrobium weinanense TaxID=2842200 RepID=A0A926Q485_9FLAO|nr:phosphatase PAP2 family protein [Sinomicrobium weinanense]MBC9796600.1 phosphatase PAP2 family protein [Sinomicrobium weinanense]MBU3123584.1 phosphatase PAP2 family protein [Sinomicrobium weinanense]
MLDKIIEYDQELFLFLNNLGTESWDGFWLFITDKFTSIPLYLVLLYLCFRKFGWKPTVLILVATALMIAFTDQLANVFKYGFERLRPCHTPSLEDRMRIVKCGGKFGYFSAHAASTFAVATFFSLLFKQHYRSIPLILLVWALVVSYSRIYLGVHFPLDIVTGMVFGLLGGWLFYAVLRLLSKKIFRKDRFNS